MKKKQGYLIVHLVNGSKLKLPMGKLTNQVVEGMEKHNLLSCDNKVIFLDKVLYLELVNVPERYAIRNYFKKTEIK